MSKKVERVGVELSGAGVTGLVTYVGDTAKSTLEPLHESEQQPLHIPSTLSKLERQGISSLPREMPMADAQALLDELADALETATIKTNAMRWFRGLVRRYRKGEFVAAGGLRIAARRARVSEARSAGSEIASRPTDQVAAKQALAHIKGLVSIRRAVDVRASANGSGNAAGGPKGTTPPAPANAPVAGPASPPGPNALTADGAQPSAPAGSASGAEQPAAQPKVPGAERNLPNNLVNELKQADSVQGASVSIQVSSHD